MPQVETIPLEVPNLTTFIVESPLYVPCLLRLFSIVELTEDERPLLPQRLPAVSVLTNPGAGFVLDAYCPSCKQPTIYAPIAESGAPAEMKKELIADYPQPLFWTARFRCGRSSTHVLAVTYRIQSNGNNVRGLRTVTVTKVGMWPALADLQKPRHQRYRKVLDDAMFGELSRAEGLAAHGIGIGAFVYLRRIFERLVDEVADSAIADGATTAEDLQGLRMEERIKLLAKRLPPFMVENRKWYGIVSKGIHELTEEECKAQFPVVRAGIEIILEQKREKLERDEIEKEASAAIQALSRSLLSEGASEG